MFSWNAGKKTLSDEPPRRAGIFTRGVKWLSLFSLCFLAVSVLQVLVIKFVDPPTSGPILLRNLQAKIEREATPTRYSWTPLEKCSINFLELVWLSEDARFFRHNGFDWIQIKYAWREAKATGRPARGASTITQQCARSLFLWQGRSWIRKVLESYYAVLMELFLSKKRILELYINVIELGDGIYGVEPAAQHYYSKPAGNLTREEAAALVAIMPSPKEWNPLQPNEKLLKKRKFLIKEFAQIALPFKTKFNDELLADAKLCREE